MRKLKLLLMSMLCANFLFAQSSEISGKIIDKSSKQVLVGANIQVVGKGGLTSDANGMFKIPCTDSLQIKVSYIGYESLKQIVSCNSEVTIAMTATSNSIEEVEISAVSNPNKSQLLQPQSLVKLKEEEIKRGTGIYLQDAINTNVPGVYMTSRTQSAGQQINIRGYGNGMGFRGVSSNFDAQGTKMYLNGIAITDAEGFTVMDDIDFGSVSNVEVLKGPSGSLYGLAIAGVINLQTQKAEKNKNSIGQDVMMGDYGLLRTTTRLAIGGEKSSLLINYGHQEFDGFMKHTATHKDFVNVMGDFDLNKKQQLTTYFGYSNSYNQRNGELEIEQYETLDYSGNAKYIKNDAHSAFKTFRAGVGHAYKFSEKWSNTSSLFGSAQAADNSSAGGWTDKYPVNVGFRTSFEAKFKLSEKVKLSGITGVEMQQLFAHSVSYSMTADSTNLSGYNVISNPKSKQALTSSTASYFTQWTLSLPNGLSVNAGLGLSSMALKLEDRMWAANNNQPGNTKLKEYTTEYNNLFAPSLAINKTIHQNMSVYFSYSTGYKAPVSSNVLVGYTGQVNTNLKPEYGTQIELGTKGSFHNNRLFYTIALFNAKFDRKFTTQTVQDAANTVTLYSYVVNGGSLDNNGLEVALNYKVIDSKTSAISLLRPFANLTYSDFKYKNYKYETVGSGGTTVVHDYSGNELAGVAPVVVNAGFDIKSKWSLYANATFNYRSAMYFTSDELNQAKEYQVLNTKLGYTKALKSFTLDAYVGANNITGTQYYAMVFINQLPDAYIPAPNKINFFSGLNLKYTF